MNNELIGCQLASCRWKLQCPILNKSDCPTNKLWQKERELNEAKEALLAEAERIVKDGG